MAQTIPNLSTFVPSTRGAHPVPASGDVSTTGNASSDEALEASAAATESVSGALAVRAQIAAGVGGNYVGAPKVRGAGAQAVRFDPAGLSAFMQPQQVYDLERLSSRALRPMADLASAAKAIQEREGASFNEWTAVETITMAVAAGIQSPDEIADFHARVRDFMRQAVEAYGEYKVAFNGTPERTEHLSEAAALKVAQIAMASGASVAEIVARVKQERGSSRSFAPYSYLGIVENYYVLEQARSMEPEAALDALRSRMAQMHDPSDRAQLIGIMIEVAQKWCEGTQDLAEYKRRNRILDGLTGAHGRALGSI